ncbi:hypothetical protein [Aquamicrobium defluvii]|nr:hypothetical protein [Aquamicrobium defluvii]
MAGVAMMAGFGIACALLIWFFATPALLIGGLHLVTRLASGEWYQAHDFWTLYSRILTVWLAIHMTIWLVIWWLDRRKEKKREAKHADFMRLRKLFYRDNEVCLDSYETLKRRAGEL